MNVELIECMASDRASSLFYDLYRYDTVDRWLRDMVEGKSKSGFLDVRVSYLGAAIGYIWQYGQLTPNYEQVLRDIESVPEPYRLIPSDRMEIICEAFESELTINL